MQIQIRLVYESRSYHYERECRLPRGRATTTRRILKASEILGGRRSLSRAGGVIGRGRGNDAYLVGKSILEFVIDRLDYEEQSDRLGALQAYRTRKGDCSEYTDLSVALARAAGLPARASYGWAYGDNGATGHAWLEFYFPGIGWQPADPSWAETGEEQTEGPRFRFLGAGFDKFAPALAGSIESYLGRLDSVHIQRSRRGIKSTESFSFHRFKGGKPSIVENREVVPLLMSEAADMFVTAAELALARASDLLESEGSEGFIEEFDLAREYLMQAKSEDQAERKLALSQRSLEHSGRIIGALGEPPKTEGPWVQLPEIPPILLSLDSW